MGLTPLLQTISLLLAFVATMWVMFKVHERNIRRVLQKNDEHRLENLVLRAEVASLRRLVLNHCSSSAVVFKEHEALPVKIKVV